MADAEQTTGPLIIGISGVSRSGKSSATKRLLAKFEKKCKCFCLCQDKYTSRKQMEAIIKDGTVPSMACNKKPTHKIFAPHLYEFNSRHTNVVFRYRGVLIQLAENKRSHKSKISVLNFFRKKVDSPLPFAVRVGGQRLCDIRNLFL